MRLVVLLALTGTLLARTELVHLRTDNSRTYDNADGTCTAEILPASGLSDTAPPTNSGYVYYYADAFIRGGPRVLYWGFGWWGPHGWVQFDLSEIPDTCSITLVKFGHFQYVNDPEVATQLTYVDADPDTCSAEQLFHAVADGEPLDTVCIHDGQQCWVIRELNPRGAFLVDSLHRAGSGSLTIGLRAAALNGTSYGIEGGNLRPFLAVSEAWLVDLAVELFPHGFPNLLCAGGRDTVFVGLRNLGVKPASGAVVRCSIAELPSVRATIDNLMPGDSTVLPLVVDVPAAPGWHRIAASCSAANDTLPANDTTSLVAWFYPRGTYSAEGFEGPYDPPLGWARVSNDTGTQQWFRNFDTTRVHMGRRSMLCRAENSMRNDDWLFSGRVVPSAGMADSVGFYCRAYMWIAPESLEVWALSGQNAEDTLSLLYAMSTDTWQFDETRLGLDEYDGRTIHVGFRCRSLGALGLLLDDVYFTRVPAPGIVEAPPRVGTERPNATVCRGIFKLPPKQPAVLVDITGRKVMSLQPGTNDIRHVPPGVYLVRLEADGFTATQKLVIQR